LDVNAESSALPPANRDCGIDQDWAGDDQDWWDWYVTLAENDDAPTALVPAPAFPTRTPPAMGNCGPNSHPPTGVPADLGLHVGAGDENRTRTISLGIRPIGASDRPDLGNRCTAIDRHAP